MSTVEEESEISLADAVEFIVDNRGRTAPTVNFGIKLIATNCVNNGRLYPSYENLRYVSQETYDNWFRAHPKPGDILLTNKGSQNGAICLVPDPVDFCIAQDMMALRANPAKVTPLYLFAALRSSVVQRRIKALNVDAVIPHLKKTDFDKLYIPLPVPPSQKWIGEFYFDFSRKIELNRRMNRTLEAMAQAIFKSWFVDFEPVKAKAAAKASGASPEAIERAAMAAIAGKTETELAQLPEPQQQSLAQAAALFPDSFQPSELGKIPEGWNLASMESLCTLNPESWSKKNHPDTVDYVDLANTKNGEIQETQFYDWDAVPSRARRVVIGGDAIVGTVRPGNRSFAIVPKAGNQLTASTGFAVLRPREKHLREFNYISITSDSNIERLTQLADGAAYPAVRPDVVAAFKLAIPEKSLLKLFSKLARPMFDLSEKNSTQSKTLAQLRDTLLPKLLSGELSVSETQSKTKEVPL